MQLRHLLATAAAVALLSSGTAVAAQDGGEPDPPAPTPTSAPVAADLPDDDLGPSYVLGGQVYFYDNGPIRVYDSRAGDDPLRPGRPRQICIWSLFYASAAWLNVTVVAPSDRYTAASGYLSVYGPVWRGTSTLNWSQSGEYANTALVPLDSSQCFNARFDGYGYAYLIVDLVGWVS